jgi:ATP-dependent exoDNAse (exonuclease V) alpha subunit
MNKISKDQNVDIAQFVERFINQTNRSIFLTGKAGTGKTTLLRKIVSSTHKNTVIVAPTGIAALNAGGVTIHSFFQLPFGSFIPDFQTPNIGVAIKAENKSTLKRHFRMNQNRISLIRNLELLIIDEVSMLRADLLDAIDWSLRSIRRNNFPFGGIQVLFIGDLHQLPPVVKNDEWELLRLYYQGIHFFNSQAIREEQPLYIELEKIYRQDDQVFISLLNNLRNNKITSEDLSLINKNIRTNLTSDERKGYITLTTHNFKADEMNTQELISLKGKSYFFDAEITGEFPPHLHPLETRMELKVGAQIMFIKNDISFDKKFYNGKMGFIDFLSSDEIIVSFPDEKKKITIERFEWSNIRY